MPQTIKVKGAIILSMKKYIQKALSLALVVGAFTANAQVKVGNNPTVINANAVLEIESTNKGLLLPRVPLTSSTSFSPLTAHVTGMAVYNTATISDVTPGYYYNDGTKWVRLGTGTGAPGTNGSTILSGSANPTTQGANGDFYLNTTSSTLFGPKAAGAWPTPGQSLIGLTGLTGSTGPTGPTGLTGTNGSTTLSGTANPLPANGANGDYFLNTTSSTLFGPKAAGAWPTPGLSLKGANGTPGTDGTNGSTTLSGTANPISTQGVNGDYFLNTATSTLFGPKVAGAWPTPGLSLKGADGTNGTASEPWFDKATNAGATLNTQEIYQTGNVGIGAAGSATSTLRVSSVDKNVFGADITVEHTSGQLLGLNAGSAYKGTVASALVRGAQIGTSAEVGSGNISTLRGMESRVSLLNGYTGTVGTGIGGLFNLAHNGTTTTGTVTNATGVQIGGNMLSNADAPGLNRKGLLIDNVINSTRQPGGSAFAIYTSQGNVSFGDTLILRSARSIQATTGAGVAAELGINPLGGGVTIGGNYVELGMRDAGDRDTYMDFHSSNATDYNARIFRGSGVDGVFGISTQGTGGLRLGVGFNTAHIAVSGAAGTAGFVGINTPTPSLRLDVNGSMRIGGSGTANVQGTQLTWSDPNLGNGAGAGAGVSGFLNNFGTGTGGFVFSTTDNNTTFTENMRIDKNGNVTIQGQVKIVGGTPGVGKVLTSDATGLASWQTVSAGTSGLNIDNITAAVAAPVTQVVAAGSLMITDSASGVVMKSPDGTNYLLTIGNGGVINIKKVLP